MGIGYGLDHDLMVFHSSGLMGYQWDIMGYSFWESNVACGNTLFSDDFPIKTFIYSGFFHCYV